MSRIDRREMAPIVERLKRFVAGQTSGAYPQLATDVDTYSKQCEYINERLQESLNLFRQGYYINAAAPAAPPEAILDDCVQLEFPNADVLGAAASVHGLPEPVILQRDWVAALSDACNKKQALEADIKHLRQLSLARRPLPARLVIMRQILQKDPTHPFLEADIRSFEREWFKEARTFCRTQPKELQLDLIDEIIVDLISGNYLEKPPQTLLESLRTQRREMLRQTLPERAQKLRLCYAELGGPGLLPQAERMFHEKRIDAFLDPLTEKFLGLAEDWKTTCLNCGADQNSSEYGAREIIIAASRILNAKQILLHQQQAADALRASIIDLNSPAPELEKIHQQAQAIGAVDGPLQQEYLTAIHRRKRRKVIRVLLLIAAVIGVLGGCALAAALF